jgi:hypothetical protein
MARMIAQLVFGASLPMIWGGSYRRDVDWLRFLGMQKTFLLTRVQRKTAKTDRGSERVIQRKPEHSHQEGLVRKPARRDGAAPNVMGRLRGDLPTATMKRPAAEIRRQGSSGQIPYLVCFGQARIELESSEIVRKNDCSAGVQTGRGQMDQFDMIPLDIE